MEAGLEHLSWAGGTLRHVDLLLVVTHPTVKALLTSDRTYGLARDLGIPVVGLVGNQTSPGDGGRLAAFARQRGSELWACVPDDEAVRHADRVGRCLLDTAPDSPSVGAIERLADRLTRFEGPGPASTPRRPAR